MQWVDQYRTWLHTRGQTSTDRAWRTFVSEHQGAPALSVIKGRGGLHHLLSEAVRTDRADRTQAREATRRRQREASRARSVDAMRAANLARPQCLGPRTLQILTDVRESGPLAVRQLQERHPITREGIRQHLKRLRNAGLVEHTVERTTSDYQAYRAT